MDDSYSFGVPERRLQRGYPLSSLFILVGFCAVLSSFCAPAVRQWLAGRLTSEELFTAAAMGGMILGATGAILGLSHHRRWRGLLMGTLVGGLLGCATGPVAVSDGQRLLTISLTVLVASVVLLGAGIALRYNHSRS